MKPGWGRPQYTARWHYFGEDGRSLCGDYPNAVRPFEGPTEQRDDNSPQNCKRCLRALRGETDEVVQVEVKKPRTMKFFCPKCGSELRDAEDTWEGRRYIYKFFACDNCKVYWDIKQDKKYSLIDFAECSLYNEPEKPRSEGE